MKRTVVGTIVVSGIAFVAWWGTPAYAAESRQDRTSVNGSVAAEAGSTYGRLSAVNGNVRVGKGAQADEAKTVNGEIVVQEDAKVGRVSTVNGSLRIGAGAVIAHEASTVNGSVALGKRARVSGDVSTVSGEIEIKGGEVGGNVSTRNGDIELTDGARVRGDLHVKKRNDSNWSWGRSEPVTVRVCSTCVVEGELRFDQPVELEVDDGAKIGKVIGDAVTRR
jgi:DUF4097 and DUF4098 domain-containing protein YvlB